MRIALVTDYYLPSLGGVQTAVKAQSDTLRDAGHEVTVFCPRGRGDAVDGDVVALPVSPVFRPDGYPFAWSPRAVERVMTRELGSRRIEVVHTHSEMFAALAGLRAARSVGIPTVHTMHGRIDVYTRHVLPWPAVTMPLLARMHASRLSHRGVRIGADAPYTATRASRAMWRVMVAQAQAVDAVLVPSDHFRQKLAAQGVTTPMTLLGNGLHPDIARAAAPPPAGRRAAGDPIHLVWVGRLSPEKRPGVFVEAVAQLGGAVRADMVGSGVAHRAVRRKAAAAAGSLRLHGAVPQSRVLDLLRGADLVVSTSVDFDNQPMVLLEAIASGVPVLVCDPDLAGVVPAGAALVTPTPDAAGVVAAIRALAADPAVLARARVAASAGAGSTAQRTDELVAVYERVIAERRTPAHRDESSRRIRTRGKPASLDSVSAAL